MGCLKLHTETTPITMKVVRKSSAVGPESAQCFMIVDPLSRDYPYVSSYNYTEGNLLKLINPDGSVDTSLNDFYYRNENYLSRDRIIGSLTLILR